ncbi:membrane protein [Streptomyces sp. A012304]|nr:membrane protein [Streptomyces sp. A012304]
MHAVIPILFVVSVEAARHAIGRIADITADKHMEGVRLTRWLLSPVPTFLLWRRMKLWELRSYEQVIKLEQERLVYQARLRSRFGRGWRRKAPVESLMPLRLARYGVPLAETAPAGLAAAGIEPALLPPAPPRQDMPTAAELPPAAAGDRAAGAAPAPQEAAPQSEQRPVPPPSPDAEPEYIPGPEESPWFQAAPHEVEYHGGYDPSYDPDQYPRWYEEEPPAEEPSPEETGSFPIPVSPGRTRELGEGGGTPDPTEDDYYQVFKKSIDGSYPTSGQLRDDVEATYGITIPPREAERMVNRFTNRHTAELQEDHIA